MRRPEIPDAIEELAKDIRGGYWNTRVIKRTNSYGDSCYSVHEVYYRLDDSIWSWTKEPIAVEFENREDYKQMMKQISDAMKKPVLELKNDELVDAKESITKWR